MPVAWATLICLLARAAGPGIPLTAVRGHPGGGGRPPGSGRPRNSLYLHKSGFGVVFSSAREIGAVGAGRHSCCGEYAKTSAGSAYLSTACPQRPPACPRVTATGADVQLRRRRGRRKDKHLAQPDLDALDEAAIAAETADKKASRRAGSWNPCTSVAGSPRGCPPGPPCPASACRVPRVYLACTRPGQGTAEQRERALSKGGHARFALRRDERAPCSRASRRTPARSAGLSRRPRRAAWTRMVAVAVTRSRCGTAQLAPSRRGR